MEGYTFKPLEDAFRVISWGRGVPSTTMVMMSALGHLEKADAVLHCDPGWEHQLTYEIGEYYSTLLARRWVHAEVIPTGNIRQEGAKEHKHIPFWTETGGPLRRQCTAHFKIKPQKRRTRELMGYDPSKAPHPPPRAVEQWIGFTTEEYTRMRGSHVKFIVNRWPLIEKNMSRRDCVAYLESHGWPIPPPSSCVG